MLTNHDLPETEYADTQLNREEVRAEVKAEYEGQINDLKAQVSSLTQQLAEVNNPPLKGMGLQDESQNKPY